MQVRKILVANSKTQQRYELQSAATTLGELKAELRDQNIDYGGMTFTEGFSKTQLLSDDSLLPTNVMHRGQVTNDLVILLTNTTKKIASGVEDRTRVAAYELINSLGEDVKDAIRDAFGRNYTQVTTADLWNFLDEYNDEDEDYDENDENEEEYDTKEIVSGVNDALKTTLSVLNTALDTLNVAQATVQGCIQQLSVLAPKSYLLGNTEVSDDEINNMIASI